CPRKNSREIPPASAAVTEPDHHDAENNSDFQESEHQLEVACLLDSDVVEDRNQRGCGDRHELSISNRKRARDDVVGEEAQGREVSQHAYETGGQRGNRCWLPDKEPGAAIKN